MGILPGLTLRSCNLTETVMFFTAVYYFQVVLFQIMSSLCCFCLRSRLHFMLTNMMYFISLSHILLNKLLLNFAGRYSDSA